VRAARPKGQRQPGKREASKAAILDRILEAALHLFENRGFHATTTKAIAERAGVAEGTIFNYFETKEDIAVHFFEREVDHAIETVRKSTHLRGAPLEEKLFALVQSQIDYLAPYERFIGEAFVAALRPSSPLVTNARSRELNARYVGFVQELIEESFGDRRPTLAAWLAPQAFWLFYLMVLLYWLNDTSPGKQSTWSLLDGSLRTGVALLRAGGEVARRARHGAPARRTASRKR
jgi:AcrR family transcriptional regulator